MKTTFTLLTIICCSLLLCSRNNKDVPPHSKHFILIGLDGMGAYGFQRAATPYMNEMVKNSVLSIKARCVLESSSSQNWMSMLTGAIPILLYGGNVIKGKIIEQGNIISDIAPTVAGLLGVTMPRECVGKFVYAAFEPKTDAQYAPIPFIKP